MRRVLGGLALASAVAGLTVALVPLRAARFPNLTPGPGNRVLECGPALTAMLLDDPLTLEHAICYLPAKGRVSAGAGLLALGLGLGLAAIPARVRRRWGLASRLGGTALTLGVGWLLAASMKTVMESCLWRTRVQGRELRPLECDIEMVPTYGQSWVLVGALSVSLWLLLSGLLPRRESGPLDTDPSVRHP